MQTKPTKSKNVESLNEIGIDYLNECFYYEVATGRFFWRVRPRNHFPSDAMWLNFNNRFSGRPAGKFDAVCGVSIRVTKLDCSYIVKGHYLLWYMSGNKFVTGNEFRFCNGLLFDVRLANLVYSKSRIHHPDGCGPGLRQRDDGKWVVNSSVNGEEASVGVFDNRKEAATARTAAEAGCYANHRPLTPFQTEWVRTCKAIGDIKEGDYFGDWEVIGERVQEFPGTFKRLCKCGRCLRDFMVGEATLVQGTSTSCWECHYLKRTEDTCYVGLECGPWVVTKIVDGSRENYRVEVQCGCGHKQEVPRDFVNEARYTMCPKCKDKETQENLYTDHWRRVTEAAAERNIAVQMDWKVAMLVMEEQDWKCKLTGLPLTFAKSNLDHNNDTTLTNASFDRITSTGIYRYGNVQWVTKRLNFIKGPVPNEEFINWCRLVAANNPSDEPIDMEFMQRRSGLGIKKSTEEELMLSISP